MGKKEEPCHHVANHPGIMLVFSLDWLLESPEESLLTEKLKCPECNQMHCMGLWVETQHQAIRQCLRWCPHTAKLRITGWRWDHLQCWPFPSLGKWSQQRNLTVKSDDWRLWSSRWNHPVDLPESFSVLIYSLIAFSPDLLLSVFRFLPCSFFLQALYKFRFLI